MSVFRDLKLCFNASWGLKGLTNHFIPIGVIKSANKPSRLTAKG